MSFEGIRLTLSDFLPGRDDGSEVEEGAVAEVATCEIGEEGQLSSYDALRPGRPLGRTGNSAKGKLYAEIRNDADAEIAASTEVRLVLRPKNGNHRTPLTEWFGADELEQDDTRRRIPLEPVSRSGRPVFGTDGRILAIEARNPSSSFTFSLSNSRLDIPAIGGY